MESSTSATNQCPEASSRSLGRGNANSAVCWTRGLGWAAVSAMVFHLAYLSPGSGVIALLLPWAVMGLATSGSPRGTFYLGLLLGLGLYGPQLGFFWGIFGPAAIALWGVLAFWLGAFTGTLRGVLSTLGPVAAALSAPFLWLGFEYFRSELYYLRFSWLNIGYALAWNEADAAFRWFGVYGIGFLACLVGSLVRFAPGAWRWMGPALGLCLIGLILTDSPRTHPSAIRIPVAGAQLEAAAPSEVPAVLDALARRYPSAALIVLPEYTLDSEPDPQLREWCRREGKFLVVGGREPLEANRFRNTAFVVDTNGTVVFRQTKSVPIQFFADGEPASSQELWQSPWGPLGIAICYDLSYTRVIDRLVRRGAVGLIIPTMDAVSWGAHQHALHARVAPVRAAEYGLPILRVASSGISQVVRADGRVTDGAPFSPEVEMFGGTWEIGGPGRVPLDRGLAPAATALAIAAPLGILLHQRLRRTRDPQSGPKNQPNAP